METIKPRAVRPGARLAVVSPASAPKPELVEKGMEALRQCGYDPVLFPSALKRGPLYYAGTLEERVADLHAAFADQSIDGIVSTRGGWGSAELLPYLDAALLRSNPKAFLGYSDHTSLHGWLRRKVGLVSFHAPMVAADFARTDGWERASWKHALEGAAEWSLDESHGLRVLRTGSAAGVLSGGCLSLVAEALGTPYAAPCEGGVLFLEDIGMKPYQWDRMLLHLRYAGVFDGVTGIVLGDMKQSVGPEEEELLEQAILHALRDFAGPIAIGLRSGHVAAPNVTLPLGIQVRLECPQDGGARLDFVETAVTI